MLRPIAGVFVNGQFVEGRLVDAALTLQQADCSVTDYSLERRNGIGWAMEERKSPRDRPKR